MDTIPAASRPSSSYTSLKRPGDGCEVVGSGSVSSHDPDGHADPLELRGKAGVLPVWASRWILCSLSCIQMAE